MRKPRADGMRGGRDPLRTILRRIRNRWRLRHLLKGTAIVLGAGLVAFLGSAYGVEWFRFSPGAVTTFRWIAWGTVLALTAWFVVRPLLKRVSDDQVALYLEEHEPSLEAAILGAVEASRARDAGEAGASPALLDRLVQRAVQRARAVDEGRRIEQPALYRATGALAVATLATLLVLLFGPATLRTGMSALVPTRAAAEVNPYSVAVEPGDITVARGSDQFVTARLEGFASAEVTLFTRSGDQESYRRLSMIPAADGSYELLLLNLAEATDYFVESDGIRSPTFRIGVEDLPYVDRMDHEYRYPAYTGLEPRVVEDAGDVAVLRGTEVRVSIASTIPTPAGRLVFDGESVVELVVGPDGELTGSFSVDGEGYYQVELALGDDRWVPGSPQYTIDLLTDAEPSIHVTKPGRDAPASPIEEVYFELEADDDYGVEEVLLVYSVNGAREDTVVVHEGAGRPLTEVTAGHTIYLEDYEVEPGDVVSYYAVARDHRGTETEAVSDIYFVNVQPFRRDFREAEPQGGAPQGGMQGQGQGERELSELQRQVIAATFNLNRDRDRYTGDEFDESTTSVALAQGRVREQVNTLVERMNNRGLSGAEDQFREIAEMLPEAIEAMNEAEAHLREGDPQPALRPEQQALRVLLKAEETYERYVTMQQGGGGGGGGGQQPNAEDLADLFELELDQLENQYETVQRGERQQANSEVDELLEKLDELARRQQQEAEAQRSRAQQGQQGGGGGAAQGQRELADETEEAARQLERLARETGDPQLQEVSRQLQEAADAMRRSAAQGGNQGASEATRAGERIEEAQRRLQRDRETRLNEDVNDALERARSLARQQEQITRDVEELPDNPADRGEQVRDINERKTDMLDDVGQLERDLKRLAAEARREDPQTARELTEAGEAVEELDLVRKIAWSRGVVEQREPRFARINERGIEADLQNLEGQVEEAARAAEQAGEPGLDEALERAQDLVRGVESMDRRLQARSQGVQGEGQAGERSGEQADSAGAEGASGERRLGDRPPGEEGQEGEAGGQEGQEGGQQQGGQQGGQQGQEGGQRGQGGQANQGEGTGDITDAQGGSSPFGGATRGTPRPFTDEEIRQYQRQYEERYQEALELRDLLRSEERDATDIEAALQALDQLRNRQSYQDLPQIAELQQTVRESLGRLEFTLRREVEGDAAGRAALRGSDDVPPGFQRLVEEYYRSLARGGGGGGGG